MKGKLYLFILVLAVVSFFLYNPKTPEPKGGKLIEITGKITNSDKKPVAKAAISLIGTTQKVYSDRDGEFVIQAGNKAQLVVSHSKYRTQEVSIDGKDRLNVTLLAADSAFEAQVRRDFPDVELVE